MYTINRQWCPKERILGKTPGWVYRGLKGLPRWNMPWKDPSDHCKPLWGVFPRGLSLGHHWRCRLYLGKSHIWGCILSQDMRRGPYYQLHRHTLSILNISRNSLNDNNQQISGTGLELTTPCPIWDMSKEWSCYQVNYPVAPYLLEIVSPQRMISLKTPYHCKGSLTFPNYLDFLW